MSTVVEGIFFKRATIKCDDPLNRNCNSSDDLHANLKNTLRYCLELGWREDLNGDLACPACRGNYKEEKSLKDLIYIVIYEDWKLSRIDIKSKHVTLGEINQILDKEVKNEIKESIQVKSVSWVDHWGYGFGRNGSSIRLVV